MDMSAALLILLSWLLQLPYDENRMMGDVGLLQLHEWQNKVGYWHAMQQVKVEQMRRLLRPVALDMDEFAKEEKLLETLAATTDALSSARTYLDSQGYHEAPLPALLVGLLEVKYDDSRRVGDIALIQIHKWMLMKDQLYLDERCKLEQMRRRPMVGSADENDILEQERLVKRYYKAMKEAERGETILMMWGYRREGSVPPEKPTPAGPK
jgi:hypothetical protein